MLWSQVISKLISIDDAALMFRTAFPGLTCEAEVFDHRNRLRVSIFDSNRRPIFQPVAFLSTDVSRMCRVESKISNFNYQLRQVPVETDPSLRSG